MGYASLLAGETEISEILDVNQDEQARIVPNDPERNGGAEYFSLIEQVSSVVGNLVDALPDVNWDEFIADARSSFNFATSAPETLEMVQQQVAGLVQGNPDMTTTFKNDSLTMGA